MILFQTENDEPITQEEADKTNKQIKILTLIVAAVAVALALSFLSTNVIAPTMNYNNGVREMEMGNYEEAIECFINAGDYKDAADQIAVCRQNYANLLAGKPDAVSYMTSAMPWTTMEDGVYGFKNDKYEDGAKYIPDYGNVIIPDVLDGQLVTAIKEKTFLNADTMVSVVIPDAVKELPDSCFYNCSALRDVTFGKNVSVIAQRCFINCTAITAMTLPQTVTAIGLRAFNNWYGLLTMKIPGAVTQIMPYTFSDCYQMKEISLPASIEKIHENAFTGCMALETVYFAGTEEEWNEIEILEGNEYLTAATVVFEK